MEERTTWAGLVSLVAVPTAYLAWVLASGGIREEGWERPLVIAFAAMAVAGVAASVLVTLAAAARAESGEELDRVDERDAMVHDRGARRSRAVLGLWVVVVFGLAVAQVAHVWIAHALLAAVVTAGLADAATRVAAYRRGW